MSIYEENVKNTRFVDGCKPVRCKCGCKRIEAKVAKDDYGDLRWLTLECKRCGNTLYYNGA